MSIQSNALIFTQTRAHIRSVYSLYFTLFEMCAAHCGGPAVQSIHTVLTISLSPVDFQFHCLMIRHMQYKFMFIVYIYRLASMQKRLPFLACVSVAQAHPNQGN